KAEEVVCRAVLVDRFLRARFAFDQTIHAAGHRKARLARDAFLAGGTPTGTKLLRLSRRGDGTAGAGEKLAGGRAEGPAASPPGAEGKPTPHPGSRDGESAGERAESEGRRDDDSGGAKPLLRLPSREVGCRRMARGSRSGSQALFRSLARRRGEPRRVTTMKRIMLVAAVLLCS